MAVQLLTQPTDPNMAYTKLVYVVSGSRYDEPQFKYVLDIMVRTGSNTGLTERIGRYKSIPANTKPGAADESYFAVFDISSVIQDYLQFDESWKTTGSLITPFHDKQFYTHRGVEYGTSPSSSVTLYQQNETTPGEPTVASTYLNVLKGTLDAQENGGYNFNTSSFVFSTAPSYPASSYDAIRGVRLSDYPYGLYGYTYDSTTSNTTYKPVTKDDYETISFINGEGFNTIQVDIVNLFTGSVSANIATGSDYAVGDIITVGVGPKNLTDYTGSFAGIITGSNWDYIQVQITPPSGISGYATYFYVNTESDRTQYFNPQFNSCNYPQTRFAFINKYGVWDYYSIWNPITKNTNLERQSFIDHQISYKTTDQTYNPAYTVNRVQNNLPNSRRGNRVYHTSPTDTYQITTDYLQQTEADWLTQLFDSPSVFLQENDDFVPVNITNASYNWKTNPRGQKTFQYTIEFMYSNQRRSTY